MKRVRRLNWTSDPFDPDELVKMHPLPCDKHTLYRDKDHKYAIHLPDDTYLEKVCGTTTLIHKYSEPFPVQASKSTAKSINDRYCKWVEAGYRHRQPWPEKYLRHITESTFEILATALQTNTPLPVAFAHRLHDDEFVRTTERNDARADKLKAWFEDPDKTPEKFMDMFKDDYEDLLALPPHYSYLDVQNDWPRFGKLFHRDVELYFNGRRDNLPHAPSREWDHFLKLAYHFKCQHIEPFRTELSVSLPDYGLCGQIDAVFHKVIDGVTEGYYIYDWKTSEKISLDEFTDPDYMDAKPMKAPWEHRKDTTRNHYLIQLNVYAQMLREEWNVGSTPLEPILSMKLYVFHKQNHSFIEVNVPDFRYNEKDFEAMQTMFADRKAQFEAQLEIEE